MGDLNMNEIKEQLNKVRESKGQKPLDNKSLTKYATQIKNVYLDVFNDENLKQNTEWCILQHLVISLNIAPYQ